MKTLLVVTDHIGQDGTGRFLTYLVNELTKTNQVKVKFLIFHRDESAFNSYLDKCVEVIYLDLSKRIRYSLLRIVKTIIGIKPDYCLYGYTQLLWLGFFTSYMHRNGIKVYFRDTIIPSLYHADENRVLTWFNKMAYQQFDTIVAQSVDMRYDLITNWGCDPRKVILINNPVKVDEVNSKASKVCPIELIDKTIFTFVAAGRLDSQKGYDIVISRMAAMKDKLSFRLFILGNGHLFEQIKQLIDINGLSDYVKLLGFKKNATTYIKHADALLLSSRYEGFPNVVLEALALGKPVFTNNCPGGINEIIKDGINGFTCNFEDQIAFEEGLCNFLNYQFDSSTIISDTRQRYDASIIMQKYQNIFS